MGTKEDSRKPAVVLLSGGLDSAAVAAWMQRRGFRVHALSVDYGQRHAAEIAAAEEIAAALGVAEHLVVPLDLRGVGGSALTSDHPVPKTADPRAPVEAGIPVTYVPARNTLFLSLALGLAEARGAHDLGIGVNALDYSGYPDCRPEFIAAFQDLAQLATREGVEGRLFTLHAPLQHLRKAEILRLARELGVPVERTLSCYDPDPAGAPCGGCEACRLRQRAELELATPVELCLGVPAAAVHELRHRCLRPDQPFTGAVYDIDELPTTTHAAAYRDGALVGVATLLEDSPPGPDPAAAPCRLRIRGMAVEPALRGRGIGARLVRALQRLAAAEGTGVWCNARTTAAGFYQGCGFRAVGEEFEMPDIGPHYRMEWAGPAPPE